MEFKKPYNLINTYSNITITVGTFPKKLQIAEIVGKIQHNISTNGYNSKIIYSFILTFIFIKTLIAIALQNVIIIIESHNGIKFNPKSK